MVAAGVISKQAPSTGSCLGFRIGGSKIKFLCFLGVSFHIIAAQNHKSELTVLDRFPDDTESRSHLAVISELHESSIMSEREQLVQPLESNHNIMNGLEPATTTNIRISPITRPIHGLASSGIQHCRIVLQSELSYKLIPVLPIDFSCSVEWGKAGWGGVIAVGHVHGHIEMAVRGLLVCGVEVGRGCRLVGGWSWIWRAVERGIGLLRRGLGCRCVHGEVGGLIYAS